MRVGRGKFHLLILVLSTKNKCRALKYVNSQNLGARLLAFLEVVEFHRVPRDFDYPIKIRVADMEAYRRVLGDCLATLPGIMQTHTCGAHHCRTVLADQASTLDPILKIWNVRTSVEMTQCGATPIRSAKCCVLRVQP
jgi:DNA-binding Lrp family transcriptional regulator